MDDATQVRLVRSAHLAAHVSYAYAAVAPRASSLVCTAGACPLDENGATVAIGDVRGQADQVMATWEVVRRHFGEHDAPSNWSKSKPSPHSAQRPAARRST